MRFLALATLMLSAAAAGPAAEAPADAAPTITDRARGLDRRDGFVPFYWDGRKGQLLLEVRTGPAELLYGAGLAGGAGLLEVPLDRGQTGNLGVCRFERSGPRVLLVQLQMTHASFVEDRERSRVVEESFPTSVLASLPVVAEEGDRVLVDATAFLLADTSVLPALKESKVGEWRQDVSRSAFSFEFERTGAFPWNTEIETVQTFVSDNPPSSVAAVLPDGRTMSLRVHHTFRKLPDPGYRPRSFDPRIGYFPMRRVDHTAPFTEPIDRFLIARWRLQKKDPAAAVSEPVEPIVYHLDRGMPEPERSAVRRAALWWNRAFERAGFRNALVIRDLPEGATFLDARYSGIEWINRAERAWSIGDVQVDPRTGEILHGVARIDSHRRRTTARMWRNLTPPGNARACQAGDSPDLSFLAAGSDAGEESLVLERLAYLSAHEVGHTLGLDHNWAATTFGWGSVMDYLAPNVQARGEELDLSDAYPKDVGDYDVLAIQWGYTAEEGARDLDAIVREGYARGIVFPLQSDPRWAEYDWGKDPVQWLSTTQAVRRVILERFGPGQLAPGEWVASLQNRFNLAYLYHRFGIQAAQQFVGGQFQTGAVAGDGQVPVAWVPAARQREALDLLLAALEPANLDIPDPILAALVPMPSGVGRSREQLASEAGAAFDRLTAARILASLIVDPLLDPERAARLTLAAGPDALTLDALLRRLVGASWGAPADATPRLAGLRRVAQREVLDALLDLGATSDAAPEVRAAVRAALMRLRADLRARRSGDPVAEAHLRLAEKDLSEFLERPETREPRARKPPPPPGRPIGQ